MFLRRFFVLLIFLSLTLPAFAETYSAKVVGVHDGDTITVLFNGHTQKIRLAQIDCPELHQDFGTRAKQATSDLCFGKEVQVNAISKDRYGRTLAEVILPDGTCLNKKLVEMGFAWNYKRYSHDPELIRHEQQAREACLGLWAGSSVAPWEYRKLKLQHRKFALPR